MESSAGQPNVERLPAAFDEQTLAQPSSVLSETAQLKSTPLGSTFLSPPAPPSGSSPDEVTTSPSRFASNSSANEALEGILAQRQENQTQVIAEIAVGLEHTSNTQKNAQVDEEQPPAKRLKLDFTSGSEEVKKDKSELASDKPVDQSPDDQPQLGGSASDESVLTQRTLSQSSSLSDSTLDGSALSPDVQTTLAQLNTSNLDIATRRNILLGRTKNKYVCEVCGRECPSKHKLKRHLSTHSEERPFSCQICGKSFKWTEYLQKHMRQQHHGGAEGGSSQSSNAGTPTKSPVVSTPSSSLPQTTTSTTSSSLKPLPSPTTKSANPAAAMNASLTAALIKSELGSCRKSTVDSGITVNMDDVLNPPASMKKSDSGTPKPMKQNASVGVNMDEEEGLTGGGAMNATHLTPLGIDQTVSVGNTHLIVTSTGQLGREDSVNIMSAGVGGDSVGNQIVGSGGQMVVSNQLGTIDVGGGHMDVTGGGGGGAMQVQVGRGGGANTHHIAMDSSGMCYATASMSQPLTTFVNGQQQHQVLPGAGGMMPGFNDGSMQTSPPIVQQQGNPLQQQQPYTQDMLQQSLSVVSQVQELNDPNSIPVSGHYSIPGDQQQVQTLPVFTDQQMATSHSMSELIPNSMSIDGLHSMTVVPVVQQQTNSDAVMMQDMSHMTQYTNYSMQNPMNATTMYGTESGTAQIPQSPVVPQSLGGAQYPQQVGPIDPTVLSNGNISQSVPQSPNVYASVASYDIGMQSQEAAGVDMVNYSTSQQNMMVQTQSDMMGGFGVMQANGLLQTPPQDMVVAGVMDPTMYGSATGASVGPTASADNNGGMGGAGGGGAQDMLMDSQTQQQQQQQMQQQADNFISQQLKEHMMQSQAEQQSHDTHVTQIQDHMTTQQQQQQQQQVPPQGSTMQQQFQTPVSNGIGEAQTVEETKDTNESKSHPNIVIVHDEDPTIERFPVVQKSKKVTMETGIQCELGPETIKSLVEEEKSLDSKDSIVDLQGEDDNGCHSEDESPHDKTVQKYPCELEGCAKAYIHRKDLIRHMKIRHGRSPIKLEPVTVEAREKPFVCAVSHCGRSYYHLKDLRRHQRLCHKVNLETRPASALKDNVEVDEDCKTQLRYPCDFPNCLRSYVHKKDLVRHKRLYHKDTANKPTIPIPVRYTESELKRIKQEVKREIDKSIEKIRLDSTGSTASNATTNGGEDPPNSALLAEPEVELSSINSSAEANSEPSSSGANNKNGAQLVLFIDPSMSSSSSAALVPSSSSSTSQQASTAMFTGTSPCVLPTSEALAVQNLSKAILSSVTASLPSSHAQLDLAASILKMASGEQVDPALISSEVASILGALEQTHMKQQLQQQQEQEQAQRENDSTSEQQSLSSLSSLSSDMLSLTSFPSTVPSTTSPVVSNSTAIDKLAPTTSKAESVIESLEIAESATTQTSASVSLERLFTTNGPGQESTTSDLTATPVN